MYILIHYLQLVSQIGPTQAWLGLGLTDPALSPSPLRGWYSILPSTYLPGQKGCSIHGPSLPHPYVLGLPSVTCSVHRI